MATESPDTVPRAVLDATRSLLRVETPADVLRVGADLVRNLGGTLVPATANDATAMPADVSFGEGTALLPAAPAGSAARARLDRYLPEFLQDARQALELSGRVERLAESASTDVLTGLPNRRMLERALGRLADSDAVIMLDLDHFKAVNDVLGHAVGDVVLRAFGGALLATVRARDTAGRYGGEEFVVILGSSANADAFLHRLQAHWLAARPQPITFSAGVARSSGDADDTMSRADAALYRAKETGRDRWAWASDQEASARSDPRDSVEPYLDDAIVGNRSGAVRLTLDLLDHRVPHEQIVVGLLGTAQREVGERWQRNELTPADEHLASGVAAAALDALASETSDRAGVGLTVVTCAEGDWHSLAAQMVGESLRTRGFGIRILGSSTPVDAVTEFLERSSSDSLAVSCSLPNLFPGVVRLIDSAHSKGIPVIVGGRAFGVGSRRAIQLGADAWAASAEEAAPILARWRVSPPVVRREPQPLDPVASQLFADADPMGGEAMKALAGAFPAMSSYDQVRLTRTREDLVFIVQFLAAAVASADDSVFLEFLSWLQDVLTHRRVPTRAILAGLEVLRPGVAAVDDGALRLLDSGHQMLVGAGTTS